MQHQPRPRRSDGLTAALTALLVVAILATACSSGSEKKGNSDPAPTPDENGVITVADHTQRGGPLALRLSAGQASGSDPAPLTVVDGEALSPDEITAVLDRVPPLPDDPDAVVDVNRPVDSIRPANATDNVAQAFPPPGEPDAPDPATGPLQVVRYQPEGDVDLAPTITITFDQPMVPVATLEQLDALAVPADISPAVAGHWQWIGTRTLRFEHQSDLIDRLPMATKYTVEIPAGTTSVTGGELADTVRFMFSTPTPNVQWVQPSEMSENDQRGLDLEPIFIVHFDQRIDPASVLAVSSLRSGGENVALRLATAAEIDADDSARAAVASGQDGRWMAVRPVASLERDTKLQLEVGPGAPSAEGPERGTETFGARYHTYAPLAVNDHSCHGDHRCEPNDQWNISFNNQLVPDSISAGDIRIDPAVAGVRITIDTWGITLLGPTVGRTDYDVTIPAGLTDEWGQTLGRDTTITMEVGPAQPLLVPFEQPMVTLDPTLSSPGLTVTTVNVDHLHVTARRVDASDMAAYLEWLREDGGYEGDLPDIGTQVFDERIDVDGREDAVVGAFVDLADALGGDHGHLLVRVATDPEITREADDWWRLRPSVSWIQSTDIGLDAIADGSDLLAWATDLATGTALDGVEVRLAAGRATTDAEGLATLALPASEANMLVGSRGDDSALLASPWQGWERWSRTDSARWYVIDDRHLYRPGEEVHLKGWVRALTLSGDARIELIEAGSEVHYVVRDVQGAELTSASVPVSALGGFDFSFDVPLGANLGDATVELTLSGGGRLDSTSYHHWFAVQEFRRPEFEVTTRAETAGPYLVGRSATVAAEATYFAGGALPDAAVDWTVTTSQSTYAPPGWDEYRFGEQIYQPYWFFEGDFGFGGRPGFVGETAVETFHGTTDATGNDYLAIAFGTAEGDVPIDLPATVTSEAVVTDVNRQAWGSSTSLLVHPGERYVGLRTARAFVEVGQPIEVDLIVTDIDGAAVAGHEVTVVAERREWQWRNGSSDEVVTESQDCTVTSETEAVTCSFPTEVGGSYALVARVADAAGRTSRTEVSTWVSGGAVAPDRRLTQDRVTLVPDLDEYQPGDTAQILVQSPFSPAEGLATISRNGLESTQRFTVADGSAVVEIAIADTDIPNLVVQVDLVGATPRTDDAGKVRDDLPARPAYATGTTVLAIPPTTRTLDVQASPAAATGEPGTDTNIDIVVRDAAGSPVADAEVLVLAVDEAVLSLAGYDLTDPTAVFYSQLEGGVSSTYGRDTVVLADPRDLEQNTGGGDDVAAGDTGGGEADFSTGYADAASGEVRERSVALAPTEESANNGSGGQPIDVRTNFDALAVFAPEVITDAAGEASVELTLPDSLTRYRIMVVAVDGNDRFGSGESNLTARLPLMVRPSAPRFLNFGDDFELPVVIQNQTDDDMTVDVALATSNLTLTAGTGRRVVVPANNRVEVRFPATTDGVGTARFQAVAVSGDAADATVIALPVYTPATAEAFATYGVIDDGTTAQPFLAPEGVLPGVGGLEISTSSTAVQALTDAVLYLEEYPYENSDGHASRILAIAALRDVLEAFDVDGLPSTTAMNARVDDDIKELLQLQDSSGGFFTWRLGERISTYRSVFAAHALVEAKANGYVVPAEPLQRALSFLGDIESWFEPWMNEESQAAVSSYAIYVRDLAGDHDSGKAFDVFTRHRNVLSAEAMAWLWPVLDDDTARNEISRSIRNAAVDTAAGVTFAVNYTDDTNVLLHSRRRADGVILDALLTEDSGSDMIEKTVAELMAGRSRGRWGNSQENTFVLLAVRHYFDTFEAVDPDFVARVWLGDLYAAEHAYEGRSTVRNESLVPMEDLITVGDTDIVIAKEGEGRLYYRLGLRYAPDDFELDALDRGFVVQREYVAIDDPGDVTRDADGTWHVRAGANVRVRLTMVADSLRNDVALIDPLPAGLEAQNPVLHGTPEVTPVNNDVLGGTRVSDSWEPWWFWSWFDHQNMRDDRVEAMTSRLWAGVYEYSYVARATTVGTFVVPPTRAEEIYAPETFGRSASDLVLVEER